MNILVLYLAFEIVLNGDGLKVPIPIATKSRSYHAFFKVA